MNLEIYKLSTLRDFLENAKTTPKKSLGQNFLFHKREVERVIAAAEVKVGERILEIGPGLGHLTSALVEAGAEVTAIEIDRNLSALFKKLHPNFPGTLIEEDFLRWEIKGTYDKVIANLPYYVAGAILEKLLSCGKIFQSFTFTLQEEEVKRLLQKAGDERYGKLNALLRILGPLKNAGRIAPENFYPKPRVASAVLHCSPLAFPETKVWNTAQAIIAAAFEKRRKMLRSNLSQFALTEENWQQAKISPSARAEEITPAQYLALAQIISAR